MSLMCRPGRADLEHGAALALERALGAAGAAPGSPSATPERLAEAALAELRALWPHIDEEVLRAAIRERLGAGEAGERAAGGTRAAGRGPARPA